MNEIGELLVSGDLHLGRPPSRIPDDRDEEAYSPATVWGHMVDEAVDREVDAVVLTGDVVDRKNQSLEAWGPLEAGLNTLNQEDIPVVLVSGNHDAGFLEDMIDSYDFSDIRLLGRGGTWERTDISLDGDPSVSLDGWSYPGPNHPRNPLEDYDLDPPEGPVLGVLHTQVDRPESGYAPVGTEDLKQSGLDGWLLGHVHTPGTVTENPPAFYPGSLQPLDPTETGPRGPRLVSIEASGSIQVQPLPLATLEYAGVTVSASDCASPHDVLAAVQDRIEERMDQQPAGPNRDLVLVRLQVEGRTEHYETLTDELDLEGRAFSLRNVDVRINRVSTDIAPKLDLDELAEGTGPVAHLAGALAGVEQGQPDEAGEALLKRLRSCWEQARNSPTYNPITEHRGPDELEPEEDTLEQMLLQQGRKVLHRLLKQKEDAS